MRQQAVVKTYSSFLHLVWWPLWEHLLCFLLLVFVSDSTEDLSQVDMMVGGKGREEWLGATSIGPSHGSSHVILVDWKWLLVELEPSLTLNWPWLYAQVVTSLSKSSMDFPCTEINVTFLSLGQPLNKHYQTQDLFGKKCRFKIQKKGRRVCNLLIHRNLMNHTQ